MSNLCLGLVVGINRAGYISCPEGYCLGSLGFLGGGKTWHVADTSFGVANDAIAMLALLCEDRAIRSVREVWLPSVLSYGVLTGSFVDRD